MSPTGIAGISGWASISIRVRMLDEVKLWGAVTAPGQLFLAQNTGKTCWTLFGFRGLGHLIDRPAFASYVHHLSNMPSCGAKIHPWPCRHLFRRPAHARAVEMPDDL